MFWFTLDKFKTIPTNVSQLYTKLYKTNTFIYTRNYMNMLTVKENRKEMRRKVYHAQAETWMKTVCHKEYEFEFRRRMMETD